MTRARVWLRPEAETMEHLAAAGVDAQRIAESMIDVGLSYSLNIVGAVLILTAGWIVASWVSRTLLKAFGRVRKMDETLKPFLANLVWYLIFAVTVIAVLNQFGVQTASIIAVLGTVGLAVGLALQGTLSNVAAGVMLLILSPFKVRDYIEAGDIVGTVISIGLFNTVFRTYDGVYLNAPNAQIWNRPILNYSRNPSRRCDLVIGISYSDNIDAAIKALMDMLTADARVHKNPPPAVFVSELGDSAVNMNMRFWCSSDDSWTIGFDFNKRGKEALEAAGCEIPFPQRDVHLHGAGGAGGPQA
ncbi:MAG: mechanosensitive ion channel family protein [Rhodospirillales bacterium]